MNLYDTFRATSRRQPDAPALLGPEPEDRLSYRQLAEAIDAAADRLHAAGLCPGDCVGLHCPSGADYIIFTYAVWRCGGCVVPIPIELADREKQEICQTIAFGLVITGPRRASFLEPFRRGTVAHSLPSPLQGSGAGGEGIAVVPVAARRDHPAGFDAVASAFIRFTSGTTGSAKGVVLSHETIRDRIAAANDVLHVGPDDRVLWVLSMSYHFAVSIVAYLSYGAAVVLPPDHFAPAVREAACRYGATLIYASPAHYAWLTEVDGGELPPTLRLAVSTTTALERSAAEKFRRRFGLPLTQALGIIEVGLPFINVDFAADRPEAVGRVLPAYRLRLEDTGLGPHHGEVLLSGKGFLDAYYEPWCPRAQIMPDGWFRTGDVGELDADGCLFLRGRTKDVISVLGAKFFPQEVEAVLLSHPAVAAACVVARPDARLGEVPYARVVAHDPAVPPTEADLLRYCRRRLAAFKVPQRIEFCPDLPRTASGKVLHRATGPSPETSHDDCHLGAP
ncbi:MAG TPA: class I adenylate-forming enzyme family protein [Gemmataceae bacterium]|nr:class I adenylate-forming enzyme family protein [Gemmataceae bacterium]